MSVIPLLARQADLWRGRASDADFSADQISEYLEIMEPLDAALFAVAARQVIEEFPVLRVYFREEAGSPAQVLAPPWSPLSAVIDLSHHANPMDAALAVIRDAEGRPFDLANPPLLEYRLLRLSAEQYIWHARYHVILIDGFGCALIAQRLADIYRALLLGTRPHSHVNVSLEMLAEDEARYVSSPRYQEDNLFWANYLAGCATATPPRQPESVATRTVRETLPLSGHLSDTVMAFARSEGLPVGTVLIAATYLFVHRATSIADFHLRLVVAAREGVWRLSPAGAANVVPLRMCITATDDLTTTARQVVTRLLGLRRRWRFGGPELRRIAYDTHGLVGGPSINVMSTQPVSFGAKASIARETFTPTPAELMIRWYVGAERITLDLVAPGSLYCLSDLALYAAGLSDILATANTKTDPDVGSRPGLRER